MSSSNTEEAPWEPIGKDYIWGPKGLDSIDKADGKTDIQGVAYAPQIKETRGKMEIELGFTDQSLSQNPNNNQAAADLSEQGTKLVYHANTYRSPLIEKYQEIAKKVGEVDPKLRETLDKIYVKLEQHKLKFPDRPL